jgi:hypothetical protein
MLKVFFTNHWYYAQEDFADFESALAYIKEKGFEASIMKPYNPRKPYAGGEQLAHWGIISGLHDYRTR